MANINWDGGQRITLKTGDTATCKALHNGQLYGMFLYNSAGNDKNIPVTVTWSNAQPPVVVTVPGTTADQGLASLVLVSGTDTTVVSAAIINTPGAQIDAWLGSVEMPTNTSGLDNRQLPANGQPQPFNKYRRYYTVPPSSWHQLTIKSDIQQFISVQFQEAFAQVNIVNPTSNPGQRVTPVGSVKEGTDYKIQLPQPGTPPQAISYFIQGNGTQWVWMDADSQQNSAAASITYQSLQAFDVV